MQQSPAPVRLAATAPRSNATHAAGHRSDAAPMALERVLRTLRLRADIPKGLRLSQLQQQVGAPKTSLHSLLQGGCNGHLKTADLWALTDRTVTGRRRLTNSIERIRPQATRRPSAQEPGAAGRRGTGCAQHGQCAAHRARRQGPGR